MELSAVRSFKQVLLRSIVLAIVYLLVHQGYHVAQGSVLTLDGIVGVFLGGLFLALVLGTVAGHLVWSMGRRVVALWAVLLLVANFSLMLELCFFSTFPLSTILKNTWVGSTESLVLALAIGLLFPPVYEEVTVGDSVRRLLSQRSWVSWVGRSGAGAVLYVVTYFVFGAIAFHFTRPYYTDPAYGLNLRLPSSGLLILKLEVVRGFIFVLAAYLLIGGVRLKRRQLAVLVGLVFFVVGGLSPLVSVQNWPIALRFYHTVEIFFQNFVTGFLLVYLLGATGVNAPRAFQVSS